MPFSFSVESSLRLDVFLSQKTGKSRQFIQEQIRLGHVLRNGKSISKISQKLAAGDTISGEFVEQAAFLGMVPVAGDLDVIYEDADLMALNKAQGIVVHPAAGFRGATLVHHLLHYLKEPKEFLETSDTRPGIVHRLDRGTSGVLLIAKHRKAQETLSRHFKLRKIKKEYEAIAWGKVKAAGEFRSTMGRDVGDRKKMSSRTAKGREALTRFQTAEVFSHFSHVRLFPHTGRTHQLRVHLSEAGHPIVGDALYAKRSTPKQIAALAPELRELLAGAKHTFLHARRLSLEHPTTGKLLEIEAPTPKNFLELLERLRKLDQ